MPLSLRNLVFTLVVFVGSSAAQPAPKVPCNSLLLYRSLLVQVSDGVKDKAADIDSVAASVPDSCKFSVGARYYDISNAEIKSRLFELSTAKEKVREEQLASLQRAVELRLRGLDSLERPVNANTSVKLQQIFARPEFRRVRGQDLNAVFEERLLQLFVKLMSLLIKDPEQALLFGKVLIWTICAIVGALLLWLVYKWVSKPRSEFVPREIMSFAPSSKNWKRWMEEARAAIAAGDIREGVHRSYWAAISFLESEGAWRPDRARTPREYLRIIQQSHPARPLLKDITSQFEVIWYGKREPGEAEGAAFVKKVEQIACR